MNERDELNRQIWSMSMNSVSVQTRKSPVMETGRDPAVLLAVKSLEESIATLGAATDDLITRLQMVMHDIPAQGEQCTAIAQTCSLEGIILTQVRSITVIRERVESALNRLEI